MGFWKSIFGSRIGGRPSQPAYQVGDRVRIKNDGPGTAKTEFTGHPEPVILEQKGRQGTVVDLPSDGIPVVKWDGGEYRVHAGMEDKTIWYKGTVHLEAFQSRMHPDWIEASVTPLGSTSPDGASSGGSGYSHVSLLNADPSKFECERCHNTNPHRRVSDQYAGDLWICASCGYKTARSKGL